MDRFENLSGATQPGIVKDLWTDFQFYCYGADKVTEYLNKLLEKEKEPTTSPMVKNSP